MSTHRFEELKSGNNNFSSEIQAAVKSELDLILSSPAFAQSNRCKRFLAFVVTQTLAGHANELKERTIGISVFARPVDYDTGGDSIVRVTSNEVRKRIGQYYRESSTNSSIQIELPRGSYVPEFRIQPSRKPGAAEQPVPTTAVAKETSVPEGSPEWGRDVTTTGPALEIFLADARNQRAEVHLPKNAGKSRLGIGLLLTTIIIAAVAFAVWRSNAGGRYPQIWDSFQHTNSPVLICLGTHNLSATTSPIKLESERFSDLVLHNEMIPVDDVTVIASMASLLGKKGIPFRVIGAGQATLTDLRRQPVILIGGIDNNWTLRLTQDLRYRIERVDPGSGKEPIASIVDSQSPDSTRWKTDFSIPVFAWKNDYAVVARIDDPTTGVPVLIDAGLGNDGSLAASELVASEVLPNRLKSDPNCSGKANFEAVIGTEIIDAKSGPPHILRLQCW